MKKAIVLIISLLPAICPAQTLEEVLSYGLPVIVINTVNGEEPTAERVVAPEGCMGQSITNATKVPGRVRIYNPGDAENPVFDSGEYVENVSGMTIKIRGNSSALTTKNPFKIKLQKKADMLMRSDKKFNDKDWALIRPTGNKQYPCPIVAMLGWQVTKSFHVSEWVPANMYVNLIFNDSYRGFYQLTETIKRNEKCRIDVDEATGYISEIDPYWWNGEVHYVESPILKNTYKFTFKYPDSDDITEGQLDAFREYLELFNASLANGTYPLYIDVESCARWLLAHQLLGTLDAGGSNIFVIRHDDQAKLQMGTLWDFDSAFSVQGSFTPIMSLHYFKQMLQNSPNKMLAREMNRIWETERGCIMAEITDFYESLLGTDFALAIDNSIEADLRKYPHKNLDDISTTVGKLRLWFSTRAEELDSLLPTLTTNDEVIQWPEGTFVLNGTEQPVCGDTLSVSSSLADLSEFSCKWTRGDALGTFDETPLSLTRNYVVTEDDYEHWLRVTICDKAGNTVFTKDIWISKLPVLYIDTDNGQPITSKNHFVSANLRIQGNENYGQQYSGITEIRGRGMASWMNYPQKPYKLKLSKKANLFGFGKSKHWVLISNFNDKSCLRNYTASRLANQLGVMGMKMTWVDVVLNGEAKGCYMLSQHVRVDNHSVNIFNWEEEAEDIASLLFSAIIMAGGELEADELPLLEETMKQNLSWVTDGMVTFKGQTYNLADYDLKQDYDITKGYLFEAAEKNSDKTAFSTPYTKFEISAPEYISTNDSMLNYVTGLWKSFEADYCHSPTTEGKPFWKYADMKSMLGVWLTNEIMGQDDLYNSRYSYIANDGKITFGPVWDFDHGGASWSVTKYAKIFYTLYRNWDFNYYKKWYPDPYLCQMTFDAYWDVARPFMMEYLSAGGELDKASAYFAEAGNTNDVIWGDYPGLNPSAEPRTSAEDVEILRTFIYEHIAWLDEQFASVKTLIEAMNRTCTYPCDPDIMDCIQDAGADGLAQPRKVIRDKHLYIIKDNKTYSIDGKKIK